MKVELVSALCSCVRDERRSRTRRFLQGLSADELQYIADFLGSCILEANLRMECGHRQLGEDIAQFERCRVAEARNCRTRSRSTLSLQDNDHKMILLLEYLDRRGSPIDHTAQA